MDSKLEQFARGMVAILQHMPAYILIKDVNSRYVDLSQSYENDFGVKRKSLIGYSDFETPWDDFANQYQRHDNLAMQNGCSDVIEAVPLSKNDVLAARSVKSPIFDHNGEILGVVGQMQVLSSHSNIGGALQALMRLDKKNGDLPHPTYQLKSYPNALHLTPRESECLFLLVRGKTAKEIGLFLQISHRTVETYIENIKIKLDVSSRSQIISKAIELGMLEIIPKEELLSHLYNHPNKWKQLFS